MTTRACGRRTSRWSIAFLLVSTQWRVAGAPAGLLYLGLDYAGVRAGLEAYAVPATPALWSDLRLMEASAAAALNGRYA